MSLHAANDDLRDELVPINRQYPLNHLVDACERYLAAKNRRLSFEWALIDGVNDQPVDAQELAVLCRRLRAHVNLIPLNPTPGYLTRGTPPERVRAFRDQLENYGVNAHGSPHPRHRDRRRLRPAAGVAPARRSPAPSLNRPRRADVAPTLHTGGVNNMVWINNRQPQTLYIAQILLYVSAVSALIFGNTGAGHHRQQPRPAHHRSSS